MKITDEQLSGILGVLKFWMNRKVAEKRWKLMPSLIDKYTLQIITEQVSKFDAIVINEGNSESEQDKIVNAYADGIIKGYKDAVKQILEFLEDLRQD